MLPISEVHFAFCGIATVAATLGYACARRAVLSPSSKPDVEAAEERSLKRKLDDSDDHGSDTEDQSRPMKRNRTPPIDKLDDDDFIQEWEIIVAPPSYEQAAKLHHSEEPVHDPPEGDCHTNDREPSPPAYETLPQPDQKGAEAERSPSPQPPQISPNEPEISPSRPMTPPKPTTPSRVTSTNAFSAYSGSRSPFASYSSPSGAVSGQTARTAPAWRHNNEVESDVFGRAGPANPLVPSPNDATTSTVTQSPLVSKDKSTPAVPSETCSLSKSFTHLTGEEEEAVKAELKGVKLFVKRGRKEFTDGMYGHVKILAQKSTSPKSDDEETPLEDEATTHARTRLLFRRDPLGQVSMNVGLNPTVRCHFDTDENILRVILMAQVSTDGKESKEDVVVYALKPGRAQKADFQSFSKTLCDHTVLKSRAVASPTTPVSGAGTASL